jgi:hypothetical protein
VSIWVSMYQVYDMFQKQEKILNTIKMDYSKDISVELGQLDYLYEYDSIDLNQKHLISKALYKMSTSWDYFYHDSMRVVLLNNLQYDK